MHWITVNFGKHAGRTLPETILSDADWFFWAFNKGDSKAGSPKRLRSLFKKPQPLEFPGPIPNFGESNIGTRTMVGSAGSASFKPIPFYCRSQLIRRLPHLDLSCIRRGKAYDKRGCRNLLRDFRHHYFGDDVRMTKRRCKEFFSDRKNFIRSSPVRSRGVPNVCFPLSPRAHGQRGQRTR
jgi:hypothetical protein